MFFFIYYSTYNGCRYSRYAYRTPATLNPRKCCAENIFCDFSSPFSRVFVRVSYTASLKSVGAFSFYNVCKSVVKAQGAGGG